ncbi:MAG: VOC family protein [Prevotella sp.]
MCIHHIAVFVRDMAAVSGFFERYLRVIRIDLYNNPATGFSSRFLHFHDGARLELMHRPDIMEPAGPPLSYGLHHLAFSLGSEEAVNELTDRLWEDGYEIESPPRTTGDGYYEAVIIGPEGIVIELTK